MKRKVITSALILVMLGASATTSHAAYRSFPRYIYSINANEEPIEIISPKGDIIVQDNLLISVRVQEDDVSVTLNVYKQDIDQSKDSLIFGPEKVEHGEKLKFYNKQIKDLSPGSYKIKFDVKDKNGDKMKSIVKSIIVKNKDVEVEKLTEELQKPSTSSNTMLKNLTEPEKK
ncbi:hypothetical protein QBE52_18875 [Clostridiaceae bacterium 35-E11]